jgi:hypothetical protein
MHIILCIVLYGCEALSLTLLEEYRLRVLLEQDADVILRPEGEEEN